METAMAYLLHVCVRFIVVFMACFPDNVWTNGQMSGNAMDLAKMNMDMMQNGCPLLPCQSVCTQMNSDSGCFECKTTCGSGSGMGIANPSMRNPMQPVGSGQFYGCNMNWAACPGQCSKMTDQLGCLRCQCHTPASVLREGLETTTQIDQSTMRPLRIGTQRILKTSELTSPVTETKDTTSLPIVSTVRVMASSKPAPAVSSLPTTIGSVNTTMAMAIVRPNTTNTNDGPTVRLTFDEAHTNTDNVSSNNNDHVTTGADEDMFAKMDSLITIISLSACFAITLTLSVVFLALWRRSITKLRRTENELYFVNKVNRQTLNEHMSDDSVYETAYAHARDVPEPPPRTPHVSPLTPMRSLSCSSTTPLKPVEEEDTTAITHDYLDLM